MCYKIGSRCGVLMIRCCQYVQVSSWAFFRACSNSRLLPGSRYDVSIDVEVAVECSRYDVPIYVEVTVECPGYGVRTYVQQQQDFFLVQNTISGMTLRVAVECLEYAVPLHMQQ